MRSTCQPTVFTQLELEWDRLLASGELDRALDRWRRADPCLASFATIDELLALLADRKVDPARQSEVLLALLTIGRTDRSAIRLVLQRFVPPLKSIAGWSQPLSQPDWAALVVSAAFEVMATYPVEARPGKVAANIVWDVRKKMYATLSDHRQWREELAGDDERMERLPAPDHADAVEATELVRWAAARCEIPRDVARVLLLTRVYGVELEEVAEYDGVPSSRLRQRRWRTERRMRSVLAEAC